MQFEAKTVFVHLKKADHVTRPDGDGDDDWWGARSREGASQGKTPHLTNYLRQANEISQGMIAVMTKNFAGIWERNHVHLIHNIGTESSLQLYLTGSHH